MSKYPKVLSFWGKMDFEFFFVTKLPRFRDHKRAQFFLFNIYNANQCCTNYEYCTVYFLQ